MLDVEKELVAAFTNALLDRVDKIEVRYDERLQNLEQEMHFVKHAADVQLKLHNKLETKLDEHIQLGGILDE